MNGRHRRLQREAPPRVPPREPAVVRRAEPLADPGEVLERAERPGDGLEALGPRLPPVGRLVARRAHLVGERPLEEVVAAPENAQVRPEELVRRAGQEVGSRGPDVYRAVRGEMDGVDVEERARGVRRVRGPGDSLPAVAASQVEHLLARL